MQLVSLQGVYLLQCLVHVQNLNLWNLPGFLSSSMDLSASISSDKLIVRRGRSWKTFLVVFILKKQTYFFSTERNKLSLCSDVFPLIHSSVGTSIKNYGCISFIRILWWVHVFEKLYMHTHECAFHSSLRTHLVQIDCIHAALGRMEERIRCPSHEKTLALIHLFISLAYSMWVLSWQLTLTVLTQVHVWVMTHANKLLACLGKRICVPIGGGAHDCMKGSSVYYRCHKRRWRCSMRNVMAEEDNQKALSQLFFFVRRFNLQKCRVRSRKNPWHRMGEHIVNSQ
jgi:hypothetical protein